MEKRFGKAFSSGDTRWQDIQQITVPQCRWNGCSNIFSELCVFLQTLSKTKNFVSQAIKYFLRRGRLKISPNKVSILMILSTFLLLTELFQPITASPSLPASFMSSRLRVRRNADALRRHRGSQCERITIPSCMDIGYNMTDVQLSPSNVFKQEEAADSVEQFTPAFRANCAKEMKLLVCAVYVPICMPQYHQFLPPCRHICERAKQGCGPKFERYKVPWPELLQCEKFPAFSTENSLCLHFNESLNKELPNLSGSKTISDSNKPGVPRTKTVYSATVMPKTNTSSLFFNTTTLLDQCTCICRPNMVSIRDRKNSLFNKVEMGQTPNCVLPCRSPYFTSDQLSYLHIWNTTLSIVCLIVAALTVGTFWIDPSRSMYPERSIFFLALCYVFVSIGFLLRALAGHEAVACEARSDRALYWTNVPLLCGVVYFLLYFFLMAGALWWVILSLTWFLASGFKWSSEAISSYSARFHVLAWVLPFVQSVFVLVISAVDGDSVSGLCFVGTQNIDNLKYLVVMPLLLYLGIGTLFSLCCFFDLCRIRTSMKKGKKKTERFDKLMGRIGIYSFIYIILSAVLLACYFYEEQNRKRWADAHNCRKFVSGGRCFVGSQFKPQLEVFVVKYSVMLLIGIANGMWICSKKTLGCWKQFYNEKFCLVFRSSNFVLCFESEKNKLKRKSTTSGSGSEDVQESEHMSLESPGSNTSTDLPPESSFNLTPTTSRSSRDESNETYDHCTSQSEYTPMNQTSLYSFEKHPKSKKRSRFTSSSGCGTLEQNSREDSCNQSLQESRCGTPRCLCVTDVNEFVPGSLESEVRLPPQHHVCSEADSNNLLVRLSLNHCPFVLQHHSIPYDRTIEVRNLSKRLLVDDHSHKHNHRHKYQPIANLSNQNQKSCHIIKR